MTRSAKPLLALKRRVSTLKQSNQSRFQIGLQGEYRAQSWLHRRGLTLLDHNLMILGSEIDILGYAPADTELWLIEVKTRRSDDYAHPSQAVGWHKRWKMLQAGEWLLDHWQLYLEWHQTSLVPAGWWPTPSQIPWKSPLSLAFPKSARFAIISVFGNQIECTDDSNW